MVPQTRRLKFELQAGKGIVSTVSVGGTAFTTKRILNVLLKITNISKNIPSSVQSQRNV